VIEVHVVGADVVARSFLDVATTLEPKLGLLKRHYAQQVANVARSMEPWARLMVESDEEGNVGSDHPGAHRSEVGFHGTDSRGHRINQGPRPALGPATDAVAPQFVEAVERALDF
jgi:hypothetical protein